MSHIITGHPDKSAIPQISTAGDVARSADVLKLLIEVSTSALFHRRGTARAL